MAVEGNNLLIRTYLHALGTEFIEGSGAVYSGNKRFLIILARAFLTQFNHSIYIPLHTYASSTEAFMGEET